MITATLSYIQNEQWKCFLLLYLIIYRNGRHFHSFHGLKIFKSKSLGHANHFGSNDKWSNLSGYIYLGYWYNDYKKDWSHVSSCILFYHPFKIVSSCILFPIFLFSYMTCSWLIIKFSSVPDDWFPQKETMKHSVASWFPPFQ